MIPEIKKILYATDLSKNSSYAFLYAVDMAEKHDAPIVMLQLLNVVLRYALCSIMALESVRKIQRKQEQETDFEEMKKRLQDFCKKMETVIGFPCAELVTKILVPLGHPVEEILKAADDEGWMRSCLDPTEKDF